MRESLTEKDISDTADALMQTGAAMQWLYKIGCYLCLIAIAAMVVWADDIIKHTEFLR